MVLRLFIPLALLLFFWITVAVQNPGEHGEHALVASSGMSQVQPQEIEAASTGDLLAAATDGVDFAGLRNEYLAMFGILVGSIILALRRRAHAMSRR